jgi:hypothetical protein
MKQNEYTDPKTILMKALAAGAVASFRPNLMGLPDSQKDIVLAYQELKDMIQAQTVLDVIAEENPESVWASDVAEPPSHLK